MSVATREELDEAVKGGCALCRHEPGHESKPHRIFVHPRCHPGAGLSVYYESGVLTIVCKRCEMEVVSVEPK